MRVRVLRTSKTPVDEQALEKLLRDAEVAIEERDEGNEDVLSTEEEAFLDDLVDDQTSEVENEGDEPNDEDLYVPDDVYLIVLVPGCAEDEEIDKIIRRAATGGGQVIGIWPEGQAAGKLPSALERLGSSLVPWDAGILKETIVSGVPTWRQPTGEYRPEPKTKRNRC